MSRNRNNKKCTKKEQMSNMIKMRNAGAQTQKKWRPGGPPLEGCGGRRVEPGGVGGPKGRGPEGGRRGPAQGGSGGGMKKNQKI